MKKFIPGEYYHMLNELPFPIVQPSYLGFQLVVQYLNQKYATEITRAEVDIYWLPHVENNIHLLNEKIAEARKTQSDYRFAWIPGTAHVVNFVYIREKGEEALFYSDSNRNPDATIPDFAQKLSKFTGLPVYTTLGNRQADLRSCFTDSLAFSRDITRRDKMTGEYLIPNFLSVLKQRAKKLGESSFEVKLPDALLKTSQISKFLDAHKESSHHVIHKNETLKLFRARYSKETVVNGQKKMVATYLIEKGYKYRDIMQIQFYLNKIPYLSETQKKAFVKEAKTLLKSPSQPNGLHEYAIQKATELGFSPEVVTPENPFLSAAMSKCGDSTVFHEIVSGQALSDLKAFYKLIPSQFHLRVLTNPEQNKKNTALHWATSYPEKFKYLLSSLSEEHRMNAVTVQGENNNTVLHWLSSKSELLEFVLRSIPEEHRLQALTAPGQNGNTVLHWLEAAPNSLMLALSLLPQNQRLEALTVAGEQGESALHWIKSKPASIKAVLSCLSKVECQALNKVLKKELPSSCSELRMLVQKSMPVGSTASFFSLKNSDSSAPVKDTGLTHP